MSRDHLQACRYDDGGIAVVATTPVIDRASVVAEAGVSTLTN
jgi:hypothetical protein